ncbi:Uma2 family endonuclease [Anabaena sp. 4-3]|uniref:Uma2 family endonuclease n=1 Tax=Anabaena sp. 4-3 TaxID=1811979 RepID=UPI000AFA75BC
MMAQEALNLVDTLLHSTQFGQKLNDVQSVVFQKSWLGCTYAAIAEELNYEHDYIKQVGSQLWRSLSLAVGEEVSKKNLQTVLSRYYLTSKNFSLNKIKHSKATSQTKTFMNQPANGVSWTSDDLEVLPKHEGTRYEIINGELFLTCTPHRRHQQVCGKIWRQLDNWSELSNLGETILSPGVLFSPVDNIIPDIVWVSRERLAKIEDEAGHLTGAPELVVEVLSPEKQHELQDKQAKLQLYSVQAVGEYWIVDYINQQVTVYRREQTELVLFGTFSGDDEITSPLLPRFSTVIRSFFPE